MLYSKSGQDLEAAVLLVEAAAGAAKRHKQLTTGGSDGLTAITADDYTAWLQTAALVFEQRLDRLAEAVALNCQVGGFFMHDKGLITAHGTSSCQVHAAVGYTGQACQL